MGGGGGCIHLMIALLDGCVTDGLRDLLMDEWVDGWIHLMIV